VDSYRNSANVFHAKLNVPDQTFILMFLICSRQAASLVLGVQSLPQLSLLVDQYLAWAVAPLLFHQLLDDAA